VSAARSAAERVQEPAGPGDRQSVPPQRDPHGHGDRRGDQLERTWTDPSGVYGWLVTVQNGPVVNRFITTAFVMFLLAGLQALIMRAQLARPLNDLLSAETYNQLFTMHGSTMMFLVTVPLMEAFAAFSLPPMLGAREMPFPRMTAFGYWTYLFGVLLFYSSFLFGSVPDTGWFAYVPLSGPVYSPGRGLDFWLLGLSVAEVAAIGTGIEIVIGVLKMRAPGMTLARMPIYLWSVLVMAYALLFGFTPLIVGTTLMELDRKAGTHFFRVAGGGDPLLWQHLFWFFGHPDVYIQFIPATGIVSLIVPTFARRRLAGHGLIAAAIMATGFISFGLWVHHMFTVGLPLLGMSFFAAASMVIAIPSGIQMFAWIVTIWQGRPRFTTAFLFALGFIVIFLLGGLTGVMVALVPFDWQVHDTYFLVAHFHYVLFGGVIFPIFAAFYYWLPKMVGRMLDERLGRWNFWLMFAGFNLAFFPMHVSGLLGMPRRVYTYEPGLGWETPNLIATAGALLLGAGVAVFAWNAFFNVMLGRGRKAPDNPWNAGTLDWSTPTPPPNEGYRTIPIVRSRYPLWEQRSLDRGTAQEERVVRGLAESPAGWRAQVVTGALDARPQAIVRLAGPSIWPLVAGLVLALNFVATLFDWYGLLLLTLLATGAVVVVWLWPSLEERESRLAGDADTVHGLPVYTSGTIAPGWWAMVHVVLFLAVALACFIFSYFYLQASGAPWAPEAAPLPDLVFPAINTAGLGAAAALAWWAERGVRRGARLAPAVGLAGTVLLGIVFLGVQVVELAHTGVRIDSHAYGSAFYTLAAYQSVVVLGGLVVAGVVQAQAWLGYFTRRRFLAVQNTALYWGYALVNWLVLAGVLYVSPRVL
jgi:cytochrome c oxidase subunit I+III